MNMDMASNTPSNTKKVPPPASPKANQKSITPAKTKAGVWRGRAVFVVKMGLIMALLYFLVQKGFISVQATQQALKQWDLIVPSLFAMLFTTFLGIIRWQWLLRAQNIHLKWTRTAQLGLIGNFFNLALPGAVSGDFVKAFYIGKELNGQRSRAFGSILFDRVAGLSALVFVSAGAVLIGLKSFARSPLFSAIQYLLVISAFLVFSFYTYLFLVREHHDPLLKLFRMLEKKVTKAGSLTRIYESLRHYHNHRLTVLKVLGISMLIHLTIGWCCYNFAQAILPSAVPLLSLYVVVPLGLLVTAIPVAPAGVGTGNVAFLYFFNLIGFDRGADVFSLYAMLQILIGCIGGVIYFRFKAKEHLPDLDTLEEQTNS